jgi:hypothetical protein
MLSQCPNRSKKQQRHDGAGIHGEELGSGSVRACASTGLSDSLEKAHLISYARWWQGYTKYTLFIVGSPSWMGVLSTMLFHIRSANFHVVQDPDCQLD